MSGRPLRLATSRTSPRILGKPLRSYQAEVARAIATAALLGKGQTYTVMMARQMGKNELSGHLEAYLLNTHRLIGGTIVKAAPSLRPQAMISRQRLIDLLGAPLTRGRWRTVQDAIAVGRARARFLSGAPESNVVGGTADLLLELDEAQYLQADKIDRDFRPMASGSFYGRALSGEEQSIFERALDQHGLEEEIGLLRLLVFMRMQHRENTDDPATNQLTMRAIDLMVKAIRAHGTGVNADQNKLEQELEQAALAIQQRAEEW